MLATNVVTLLSLVASVSAYINNPAAVFPGWDSKRKDIFRRPAEHGHTELKRAFVGKPEDFPLNRPHYRRAFYITIPSAVVRRPGIKPRTSIYGDLKLREPGFSALSRAFRRQAQCADETSECGDSPGTCCADSEHCVVIDGEEGCCPIGEDCTFGGALECEDSSQILCDGLDFCCPPEYSCSISNSGVRQCLGVDDRFSAVPITGALPTDSDVPISSTVPLPSPSTVPASSSSLPTIDTTEPPPSFTATRRPTSTSSVPSLTPEPTRSVTTSTSIRSVTSTTLTETSEVPTDTSSIEPTSESELPTSSDITTVTVSSTTSTMALPTSTSPSSSTSTPTSAPTSAPPPTSTSSSSNSTYTFTPSPPPAPGTINSTILATDAQITYTGSWSDGTACSGTSRRTGTTGDKLEIRFTGTAIYADTVIGAGSGTFRATVDGQAVDVDASASNGLVNTESGCAISWSRWGLRNVEHTIELEFVGPSSALEFSRFIITRTGRGATGDTPAESNAEDTSGVVGMASGPKAFIVPGIVAFLMATLV